MNNLKIVLIDDEQAIRTVCKFYLQDVEGVNVVGEAENIKQAKKIIETTEPNLVLLDIQMGKETGFDLLAMFPNPNFQIIFITAFEQYALNAIKAGALDYLLKPIAETDFINAINKARQKTEIDKGQLQIAQDTYTKKTVERITLSANDGYHLIWVKDIMYCSSSGNYTTFHLFSGKNIMVSKILKDFEALLPSVNFLRVHQSYLVNMNYVAQLTKEQSLILTNNAEIIVATRKKEEVMQWLKRLG